MSAAASPSRADDDAGRRDASRSPPPENVDTMALSPSDASWTLGRGGATKRKIARVSGARLDLDDERDGAVLRISGDAAARQRAKDYVGFILAQRNGAPSLDASRPRDDLSVMRVPRDCVGYVMGRGGLALRDTEDEFETLMFFFTDANANASAEAHADSLLAVFGTRRGRRGAELKVMSAVEHKRPGWFLDGDRLRRPLRQPGDDEGDDFDYDTFPFKDDEYSYALGARGSTRKKIVDASGAVVEYVGRVAFLVGNRRQRALAKDYLEWLLEQKNGAQCRVDVRGRDDVDVVEAPRSAVGYVAGYRGRSLREIERETRTFIFVNDTDTGGGGADAEIAEILVCGERAERRERAVRIVRERVEYSLRNPPPDRDRGRRRSRSPDAPRREREGGGGGVRGGAGGYYYRGSSRDEYYRSGSRSPVPPEGRRERDRGRYHPYDRDGGRDRRSEVCQDFLRGRCRRDRCRFAHEDDGGR